jgi:hypothetical protein
LAVDEGYDPPVPPPIEVIVEKIELDPGDPCVVELLFVLGPTPPLPPAPTVTVIGVEAATANPVAVLNPPAPPPPPPLAAPPPPPATTRYSTVGVTEGASLPVILSPLVKTIPLLICIVFPYMA